MNKTFTASAIGFAALLSATAVLAQSSGDQSGENVEAKNEAAAEAGATDVERLATAQALYDMALRDSDPVLAIAAARLAASVGEASFEAEATEEPVPADTPDGADGADTGAAPSVDEMIAGARDLAGGDPTLTAMIDAADDSASRGRVGGSATAVRSLPGRTRGTYNIRFEGRRPAQVWINGGGDGDLDLHVYDQNGNLICRSIEYGDRESCSWRPRWTGNFRIVVTNLDRFTNRYRITTN